MKIKEGFMKRQVGDRTVVVPLGEAAKEFHGMMNLNETGGELWDLLLEETDEETVVGKMLEMYEIDADRAKESLQAFLEKLREAGVLDER